MMKSRRYLPIAAIAAVALVAAACSSSGDDMATVTPPVVTPPVVTPPTQPVPVDVTMGLALAMAEQAALKGELPATGDSDTLNIAAGGTETRAAVVFSCASAYPCTVTLTNNLGTIVAEWSSQTLGDGTANVMAGIPVTPETDPFAELNIGNGTSVAEILREEFGKTDTGSAYSGDDSALGGLGLGDSGASDIDGVTLKSFLNPNATDYDSGGTTPTGSTLTSSGPDNDNVTTNAGTVAQAGWGHKVLFRDWGDTGTGGDGGFETGALIYSDMGPPKSAPFDSKLADMFVNGVAHDSYDFTTKFAATDPIFNAVAIDIATERKADEQTRSMVLTVEASQLATLADTVEINSEHQGSYFGASGTYKCIKECAIRRATAGSTSFGVDLTTNKDAEWRFKPDDGETIMVPDQDWMVYGAWLTTPDDAAGTHRVGVFFHGMDEYGNADALKEKGLTGSATYSGGAAGVYVDGSATGMFTADASLTANFDVNGNGKDETGDYELSGRIDNFKNTAGAYLGADTAADPNDPVSGGENDWVVQFTATDLSEKTKIGKGLTGSADGVLWKGQWNAQFYGLDDDGTADRKAVAPTGVAGNFRAITAAPTNKGVVGAFGAQMDPPAN